jgi:hypothetical protein
VIVDPVDLLNPFTDGGYNYLVTVGGLSIDNSTTPACLGLDNDLRTQTQAIRLEIDDIKEGARRLGIYPGVMRDLFAQSLPPAR